MISLLHYGHARPEGDRLRERVRAALEARQRQAERPSETAQEWLIAPHVCRDGRDSLGRGLDPDSITVAIAADARVKRPGPSPRATRIAPTETRTRRSIG